MTQNWSWQAGFSAGLMVSILVWANGVMAQLQPVADDALGEERSVVSASETNGIPGNLITGGAQRGANLFHSFQAFGIDEGQAAYFANPDGVENILGRVTGGGRSDILGQLGVLGEANLFLMNPNGIVFGPNSSLDIGGSFLATTADAIGFGEQGWFSATTPEVPSPLLTIHPSAFFFNQMQTSPITVRSMAPIVPASDPTFFVPFGLGVGAGENLALLGGDINIEGGGLNAPGGRIDLGAIDNTGIIGLNADGSFDFPAETQRGDIVFTDMAQVDVRTSTSGGVMAMSGQRIAMTGDSLLLAGILSGQGSLESQAGAIRLDATEHISLTQLSRIANVVFPNSQGNAGNIEINTAVLEVLDGVQLIASTFGQGNAGNVTVIASDRVTFQGESIDGRLSAAFSTVGQEGVGAGGNIEITTAILEVLDGASLTTDTDGRGNAGNVIIIASDRVTFQGESSNGNVSAAFSTVEQEGIGAGGNIEITTAILEILDGASLTTHTNGRGNAGNVIITASDRVTFQGRSKNGLSGSSASSRVVRGSQGNGGDIEITAAILEVLDGARLSASTFGQGEAGDLRIMAREQVLLDGVSLTGSPSALFSSTSLSATEGGGSVILTTPHLQIANGAVIDVGTTGDQPGGSILVEADQVTLSGGGQVITATTEGAGEAGDITIHADHVHLSGRDPTFAQRLELFGRERTINEGNGESGLFASTRPDTTGAGGNITVNTTDLTVSDYAQITAQSQGTGAAGNVRIQAQDTIALDHHASINSDTNGGQGDIDLSTGLLVLQDNSTITTNASGPATGGNIDIEADFIVAAPNENSDIFANAVEGSGGQITLTARAIFGLESRTRAELQELLGDDPSALSPRNLPSNDVTAFSQANPTLDVGTVTFQIQDVDPSQGLVELPSVPLAAADQIVQICPSAGRRTAVSLENEFVVTGRGGLPMNPLAPLEGDGILAGWASLDDEADTAAEALSETPVEMRAQRAIVEATSWRRDAEGKVVLMAAAGISQLPLAVPGVLGCRS